MICTNCGSEGTFGVTCTTLTKVYRKSLCNKCRLVHTRQHRELKKQHKTPPEACQCCGGKKTLVIDHCHATGAFRGWLCQRCNVCIGGLGDTTETIQRALDYLTRPASQ
jgi:hypothetical protein